MPARDGDEGNGLGVVTDLLDEGGGFLDDFVEAVLAPLEPMSTLMIMLERKKTNLGGVHLVDSNDELTDTKGEGQKSVLAGLAILGDTSLELTSTTGDDEDSAIGLGGTGDHVLDEITVSRGINDLSGRID